MVLDEISGLLGQRLVTRVATLSQITDLLKKTEQSQRVLDEASPKAWPSTSSRMKTIADENISIERLTADEDISPIIRLVDTTIFTALERRASDIHLETFDDSLLRSSTASTESSSRPWPPSPGSTTRPSSPASRSCPSSTSPSAASRRTDVSASATKVASSTSASPSCLPSTAKTPSFASSTKSRCPKSLPSSHSTS